MGFSEFISSANSVADTSIIRQGPKVQGGGVFAGLGRYSAFWGHSGARQGGQERAEGQLGAGGGIGAGRGG